MVVLVALTVCMRRQGAHALHLRPTAHIQICCVHEHDKFADSDVQLPLQSLYPAVPHACCNGLLLGTSPVMLYVPSLPA